MSTPKYRKISKNKPRGLYFSKTLFEGLIWREICVSKSIGLAFIVGRKFIVFALFYSLFEGNFQVQAPGGLYLKGRFNGGFFALRILGAYIWRGVYMEGLIFRILR